MGGCAHWNQLGSQQLWQMLSIPIVLCRRVAEPDAPKSEEIWTQRFSADGRACATTSQRRARERLWKGFGGKNRVSSSVSAAGGSRSGKEVDPPDPICILRKLRLIRTFFIQLGRFGASDRRVGNSYVTRNDCTAFGGMVKVSNHESKGLVGKSRIIVNPSI